MLEIMPNAGDIKFKPKFVEHYSKLTDFDEFRKYSLAFLRKSIRVNTLKISIPELKKRLEDKWTLTQVPWCKEGFWIAGERRDIGNLAEHVLGYIYVQESASMMPPVVLAPREHETVLDMCAAPGSKTTQIAQYMNNTGVVVGNDVEGGRLKSLKVNVQRMGASNVVVSKTAGRFFKNLEFDRILVDAPCSGIGTIRKSIKTINMWNLNMVKRIAGTQRQLIQTAFDILKPGGTMVYSTCTLEPIENEGTVSFLLNKNDNAKLEDIELDINRSPCVTEFGKDVYHPDVKKCLRIWPQDNNTEGFFVSKIKKKK